MRKFKKLIKNPNLFFFDYFAKKIGNKRNEFNLDTNQYRIPPGGSFDIKIHPWVQIANEFKLRTGATSGHPDQSLLLDQKILLDFLIFTMRISYEFKCDMRLYTHIRNFEVIVKGSQLLIPSEAKWIYSKIFSESNFIIEFIGEFDNNFAAHIFLFVIEDTVNIKSKKAFIKKSTQESFEKIYPTIINKFGNYEFGTPWPVDIVFTWVDKEDPVWIKMWKKTFPEKQFNSDQYTNHDELRYSLRAICKYLPWFRKIYIVSNCRRPNWLKDHHKINWVEHEKIFPDQSVLPTFNSHAIEACLHLITGLSESFIYFNDDVFVNSPCYYNDFFDYEGYSKAQLETHGSVFEGNLFDERAEYLAPAINSQRLIKQKFPFYQATNLHKHTPHALNKKILEEIGNNFSSEITKTRASRLRSKEDINLSSFMYHHFALAKGKASLINFSDVILRPSNIENVLKSKIKTCKFICFNDGGGSYKNHNYKWKFKDYLNKTFPSKCSFELSNCKVFDSVNLSVTIMAHKDRAHRVAYLKSKLGDVNISMDVGKLGIYENSRQSWMMHNPSADFHLVIQDDSIICQNFFQKINGFISNHDDLQDRVYCLYFRLKGNKNKVFVNFNRNARKGLASGFFIDDYLRFGIAVIVPTHLINEMIEFADKLDQLDHHDDTRYSTFFARHGIKVIYPLPSLVDQDPKLCSLNKTGAKINLQATWFVDGENGFKKDQSIIKENTDIDNHIPLFYWGGNNFGDKISPYLIKKITGKAVVNIYNKKNVFGLISIGSIIQHIDRKDMFIWGSGIMRGYGKDVSKKLSLLKPKKIAAVRGLKTRDYLVNRLGWEVPEIFGDPALLMPRFYTPIKSEQGIVICPHYQHYKKFKIFTRDFTLINVEDDVEKIIDLLANASAVISTSLHGLIIAQAYSIPWVWLRIIDNPLKGDDFKFEDFFSTLDRDKVTIFNILLDKIEDINFNKLASTATLPELKINLQVLFDSFPIEYLKIRS